MKLKLKNAGKLNLMYNGIIEIKQYSKVTYLDCLLDETMPGESMVLNQKLKFLYKKNWLLIPELQQLLFNAMII